MIVLPSLRRRGRPAEPPVPPAEQLNARQTTWLVVALAITTSEHVERLPVWITLLAIGSATLRLLLAARGLGMPPRWLLLFPVLAATGGIYMSYGTIIGRDAGVALLVMMLSLKLLEMQTRRDAMIVAFLGYFVIITAFLYSQTIPSAAVMVAALVVLTATMVEINRGADTRSWQDSARLSVVMLVQSVPLMLLLFLLFPRVQGPLWGLPQDAHAGLTGLSDTMTPGSISRLGVSDAVSFRVTFEKSIPEAKSLYWRGPVLWYFDGATWHAGLSLDNSAPVYTGSGSPVTYTVTLEPHNKRWLFLLDLPAKAPAESRIASDFQTFATRPVRQRMRYEAASYLAYSAGAGLSAVERRRALQMPEGANWRARSLAENMRLGARDAPEMVRSVLAMFRNQNFSYTLTPPLLGENPVDEFLFNTRSGFCEHYASAFVFLMRAAGIPARIVTGYQGGEVNTVGNYLIVRQSEAHAWAEVWLEGEGWIRVDPTAAVSPLRVESGIAAAVPQTDPLPLLARADAAWIRQLRFAWDSVANSWNQWVLGYTPERQIRLLSQVGLDAIDWKNLVAALLVSTGIVTLALAAVVLRRLRSLRPDPVVAAWRRFCAKLERAGTARRPDEGPIDYAARVAAARPDLSTRVSAIAGLYADLRYGARPERHRVRELERLVAALDT